eukprot:scpid43064/ scgid15324/ 
MTPRTDVCSTCEQLRRAVMSAASEADKLKACDTLSSHITHAQAERQYYKQKTLDARAEMEQPTGEQRKCVHYTFGFAQNVFLPQTARQEGPLYFKTPFKVQLFGVCCEAIPRQVNYLLGEADTIGEDGKKSHNPNSVVSLLHHYFAVHGLGEDQCFLHADNCAGQNKNRTVMAYLAWRCITGLHQRISLSFMITGHTRCLVDGLFGLLKQKYR